MADDNTIPPAPDNTGSPAENDSAMIDPTSAESSQGDPQNESSGGGDAPMIQPNGQNNDEPEGAPESYEDFSMPEGFVLDGDEKENVHGMFRELNLSQKQAQTLVDYFSKRMIDDKARIVEDLATRRKNWRAELRSRPDHKTEAAQVERAVRRFLKEPDEIEMFKDSWLSDHPVFWKVFARIGAELGEDALPPKGGDAVTKDTAIQRFPVKL